MVVRWTARGTHRGKFRGIAPTGPEVSWGGITIYRLAGGRLVAGWSKSDQLGLLQQLGATVGRPGRRPTPPGTVQPRRAAAPCGGHRGAPVSGQST